MATTIAPPPPPLLATAPVAANTLPTAAPQATRRPAAPAERDDPASGKPGERRSVPGRSRRNTVDLKV